MKIEDINKENIFKTPDGYFDSLNDRLKERINETETVVNTRTIIIGRYYKYAAAVAIILISIFSVMQIIEKPVDTEELISQIPSDALIEYLLESDVSEDELLATLDLSLFNDNDDDIQEYLFDTEPIDTELLDEIIDEFEIETTYL